MVMKNGEVVFFEGNFAAARIPRRMFLAPENLFQVSCLMPVDVTLL